MKRGITVLLSLSVLVTGAYFTVSKWAISHETLMFKDPSRNNRPVEVSVAVRRDKELQADAGMIKLPVAVINHGNTVKFTEYSFLSNVFAWRGYMVVSIQHDLPTDAPMVTKAGELYVGRLPQIQRGVTNIKFAIDELKKVQPNADYNKLTMVGHSMGGHVLIRHASSAQPYFERIVLTAPLRMARGTALDFAEAHKTDASDDRNTAFLDGLGHDPRTVLAGPSALALDWVVRRHPVDYAFIPANDYTLRLLRERHRVGTLILNDPPSVGKGLSRYALAEAGLQGGARRVAEQPGAPAGRRSATARCLPGPTTGLPRRPTALTTPGQPFESETRVIPAQCRRFAPHSNTPPCPCASWPRSPRDCGSSPAAGPNR